MLNYHIFTWYQSRVNPYLGLIHTSIGLVERVKKRGLSGLESTLIGEWTVMVYLYIDVDNLRRQSFRHDQANFSS